MGQPSIDPDLIARFEQDARPLARSLPYLRGGQPGLSRWVGGMIVAVMGGAQAFSTVAAPAWAPRPGPRA